MTFVKAGESVFWECQELLRIWRQEHPWRQAQWLVLGDNEYARLIDECSALAPDKSSKSITAFQGVNVVHWAVLTHLEVVG